MLFLRLVFGITNVSYCLRGLARFVIVHRLLRLKLTCTCFVCIVQVVDRRPSPTFLISRFLWLKFVSGPPRYHLAIKGVREQFVVVEQNSGP